MSDPFLDALNAKAGPVADPGTMATMAEQKYGLPSGVMSGLIHVESRGNPNAVSPQGAVGIAQLLPSTAASLGVDPSDPSQAIDGAARYLKEGIDKTGSLNGGLMYYHGGPNQAIWGPKTQAYPGQVLAAAGTNVEGGDPTAVAASDPNDPFLAALDQHTQGNAGSPGGQDSGNPVQPGGSGNNAGVDPSPVGAQPGLGARVGSTLASLDPLSDSLVNGTSYGRNLQDAAAGVVHGVAQVPETMLDLAAGTIDKTGYGAKTAATLRDWAQGLDDKTKGLANDPNSNIFASRKLGGEILGTLPVSEITPFASASTKSAGLAKALAEMAPESALPESVTALAAGKAPMLARAADMSLQGAAGADLLSRGQNLGTNTAIGALAAPALGAALEKGLPLALKGGSALGNTKIAQALKDMAPAASEDAAPAATQTIAKASDLPRGYTNNGDGTFTRPDGKRTIVVDITPDIPSEALGSRGARTGIEAHDQMPQDVAATYADLTKQGVAPDEALREADIRGVGAQPTASMVTRNPAMMAAEKEGAKSESVAGLALNRQQAEANAALHSTTRGMVQDLGGAPEPGEAMQTAAQNLKSASDAAYQKVNDAYAQARQVDGDARVPPDQIRSVLNSKEAQAAVAGGGPEGQLINTVSKLTDLYSDGGTVGITPEDYNSIIRTANGKYDPMGGGVNHWVGQINGAADQGLDGFDQAGPAYRAARSQMKDFASQYRDPKGVAGLIKTDSSGNLINDDSWRTAENMIGAKNDKPFIQIVKQLQTTGDTASLNKLKASIIQDAYEKATGARSGTAADQMGNSVFQGSQFHNRLNQIGMNKLKALFTPAEIAKLASVGRAGVAINEAVPGAVNTSGTAAALQNAQARLAKAAPGKAGKVISHALHAALPIGGAFLHGVEGSGIGVGIDAALHGAGAAAEMSAKRRAAEQIAKQLKILSSPQATRAADQAHAKALADELIRRATARAAADRSAPVAAALSERR